MIKHFVGLAALATMALSSGAALADARDPAAPQATPTPATAEKTRAKEQRICVVDLETGSRIPKKTCKTRSEWKAEGVDPLNP